MTNKMLTKLIGVTPTYWCMVKNCDRSLSYKKAKLAASIIGTNIEMWMKGYGTKKLRQEAWKNYEQRSSETASSTTGSGNKEALSDQGRNIGSCNG